MTIWEAIFLGIIQGITEFLPVSSSGHLQLSQYFLGFEELNRYILFNLICHLGTLGAIFYFFSSEIKKAFKNRKTFFQVVVGTLPLVPLVFILKIIKDTIDQPQYLGFFFIISAILIYLGTRIKLPSNSERKTWKDPLTIGVFQAIAILPGISRSGSTVSAARLLGWQKEEALSFSFLLAIPAILGGTLIETLQLLKNPSTHSIHFLQFFLGFCTSFLVGCLTLRLLMRLLLQDKWIYFAWYCLIIGLMTTLYFY